MLARKLSGATASSPVIGSTIFRGSTSISDLTVSLSSIPIQSNDLIVVLSSNDSGSPAVVSGFDLVYQSTNVDYDIASSVYVKRLSTAPSSVFISWAASPVKYSGVVAVFRGYTDAVSHATANGNIGMPNPPNLTSLSPGQLILACGHIADSTSFSVQSGFKAVRSANDNGTDGIGGASTALSFAIATSTSLDPGAFIGFKNEPWFAGTIKCPIA